MATYRDVSKPGSLLNIGEINPNVLCVEIIDNTGSHTVAIGAPDILLLINDLKAWYSQDR